MPFTYQIVKQSQLGFWSAYFISAKSFIKATSYQYFLMEHISCIFVASVHLFVLPKALKSINHETQLHN